MKGACTALAIALSIGLTTGAARAQTVEQMQAMSLDELAHIDVSSVSKSAQPLSDAAGAIYVISQEDIARSGATTIPEILRLAPNLEVFQKSSSEYVITARGLNGQSAAQSFSNKLLVLVDGRSVYSPLFSGVYWDMQDVVPEDIERIEVISGPGATLWGANAVNGVINIITKRAADSQGALIDVRGGDFTRSLAARFGGSAGSSLTYRVYLHAMDGDQSRTASGAPAHDGWFRVQGGFRLDWSPTAGDAVTLQGDAFGGAHHQLDAPDEDIAGRDILARWVHDGNDGSRLQLQAYYDYAKRLTEDGNGHFDVNTYDLELQHNLSLGAGNQLVWGAGIRASRYSIHGTTNLFFIPSGRTLLLANLFVQDSWSVTPRLTATGGFKIERDPYVGVSPLPSLRLAWKPAASTLIWGAVSRAVRSATPFDEDVKERFGGIIYLSGNRRFRTEKLTAFELGTRLQPLPALSLSISGYYNLYDDLRSIELSPGGLPLIWGNGLKGHGYGLEAWADYRVASWWKLSAGLNVMRERFHFAPGSSGILGPGQNGDDPRHQYTFRSTMNLGKSVMLDADFRAVGALPAPHVPAYAELNGRLAWAVSPHLELSISGHNLLHRRHVEYAGGNAIPRSVVAGLRWRP